jgi:hypothetical protein
MNKYHRILTITFGRILRILSFCVPKRKGLVVLGSKLTREGSNAYALFKILNSIHNIDAHYIYKKKGLVDFLKILRAEVIAYDSYITDLSYSLSGGSRTINLWHGISAKNIERMISKGKMKRFYGENFFTKFLFPDLNFEPSAILSCSDVMDKKFIRKAFKIKKSKIIRSEYPRLFGNSIARDRKFLLWAPTWFETEIHPHEETYQMLLMKIAETRGLVFLFRPHPNAKNSKFSSDMKYSEVTVSEALNKTEILFTDISSIVFDFIKLGGSKVIIDRVGLQIIEKIRGLNKDLISLYSGFMNVRDPYELEKINIQEITEQEKETINNVLGKGKGINELICWIKNG